MFLLFNEDINLLKHLLLLSILLLTFDIMWPLKNTAHQRERRHTLCERLAVCLTSRVPFCYPRKEE